MTWLSVSSINRSFGVWLGGTEKTPQLRVSEGGREHKKNQAHAC